MIFASQLLICGVNFPQCTGNIKWNIIVLSSTFVLAVILGFMAYQFVVSFFPFLVRAFPQMLMQGVSEKAFSPCYLQQPFNSSYAHFCHLKWFHTPHLCLSSLYLNSWELRSKLTWRSSGKRLLIQFSLSTSHGRMFSLTVILCVHGFI